MESENIGFIPVTDFEFNLTSGAAADIAEVTTAGIIYQAHSKLLPYKVGLYKNSGARFFSRSDVLLYKFNREKRNRKIMARQAPPKLLQPKTEFLIF